MMSSCCRSVHGPEQFQGASRHRGGTWQSQGDLFVVPVTSQLSNADLPLNEWQAAGLNVPSGIKGQICTVEDRLVRKVVGSISDQDRGALDAQLRQLLKL